ncbi:uncharacterized protein BCR38DRAFT_451894 [Pseudomassariella vexata]|uniref:Dockerin type 1 n=1 Tax=Pseudomassariella vexata TaxID=1141098 RepID=A0A1Y2D9J2_9PEZI|nr:uncharacterized protein BCR38DRAFT_451894 [Pseudomassariella vexata]ORY55930.1 hypothetical protein BCR38DRAFT_451894 [Pseudomassariella vexata]
MLPDPSISVLGPDPTHRKCFLNGNAFQQDAIQSFNGWQYACFYSPLPSADDEPLYVHLSRRKLPLGKWETLVFDDYAQTMDDGHNTVQLGICPGDGTIHLSFDHHCDVLRFRYSRLKIAQHPEDFTWEAKCFSPTLDFLPGLQGEKALFGYVTYPRFGPLSSDLWFSFRTGKAGLGDDHLCVYKSATGKYQLLGTNLAGINNNPYIHGIDYRNSRLYVTWVYRGFVWYEGWDDPKDTKHKAQAGPNSGENNYNICFAYSDDEGRTWRNGAGLHIADLSKGESVTPASPGIVAFEIPRGSGLSNQESQAVDHEGGVHVLNRDKMSGEQRWKHYYRSPKADWTQHALPHVEGVYGGKRGRLAISRDDDLYLVLPHHKSTTLSILKATKATRYSEYELVWRQDGFPPTEPLVDILRLDRDNVLSVLTRANVDRTGERKNVVVLDFQL